MVYVCPPAVVTVGRAIEVSQDSVGFLSFTQRDMAASYLQATLTLPSPLPCSWFGGCDGGWLVESRSKEFPERRGPFRVRFQAQTYHSITLGDLVHVVTQHGSKELLHGALRAGRDRDLAGGVHSPHGRFRGEFSLHCYQITFIEVVVEDRVSGGDWIVCLMTELEVFTRNANPLKILSRSSFQSPEALTDKSGYTNAISL